MASKGLFSWLGGLFGRKKPVAPKLPPRQKEPIGHRGIHATSIPMRERRAEAMREWEAKLPPHLRNRQDRARRDAELQRKIRNGQIEAPPEEMYSAEETERWSYLTEGDVEGFLYNNELLVVNSSNVNAAQYYPEEQKMMVEFRNGSAYLYSNVSLDEARLFVREKSKGSFIWNQFRVRGSRTAHQKPYLRIK